MKLRKTAASLLAIGMAVQILTGIIWIVCNFPSQWSYPESEYYISVAESLVMDEYTGILYPVLIRICQAVMGLFGLPFEGLMYIVQLAVAFFCCSAFVWLCGRGRHAAGTGDGLGRHAAEVGDGLGRNVAGARGGYGAQAVFGGLYLLTVPLCVQWHLSILPNSLTGSLFLLLLGICVRAVRDTSYCDRRLAVRVSILWAALTMLNPDYWWLGLVPVIFMSCLVIRGKGWKAAAMFLMVTVVAGALAVGINSTLQSPGSSGKIQRSLGAAMVSRMVWPNFDTNYFFWPEEVKAVLTQEEAGEISKYADQVQNVFGPMVESSYGKEKADELYWQMALNCMKIRTREIVQAVSEDFLAYFAAPWQVKTQLDGSGLSYSGWNYGKMKTETPGLTRWYMDYGLVSFRVGLVIVVGLLLRSLLLKRAKMSGAVNSNCAAEKIRAGFIFSSAISQALWYTMCGAGIMDYRNVAVVIMIWYSCIVAAYVELTLMGK